MECFHTPSRPRWRSPAGSKKPSLGVRHLNRKFWGGPEVITMSNNTRQTGPKAASNAGKVLADPKSTKAEKSAAASALTQTPTKKK